MHTDPPPDFRTATQPSSTLRVICAQDYRRERWRNGAGWTREILRDADAQDWAWRLSIAEIESAAEFSVFPGVERELVLLSGEGLRLRFEPDAASAGAPSDAVPDAHTRVIEPPHGRCRFPGERTASASLEAGPVHVFNLMWRRDRIQAELWHRPLVGSMVLFAEPGEHWLLFLIAGRASIRDGDGHWQIAAQDTAMVSARGARTRCMLEGGGELLLMRLRAVAEPVSEPMPQPVSG